MGERTAWSRFRQLARADEAGWTRVASATEQEREKLMRRTTYSCRYETDLDEKRAGEPGDAELALLESLESAGAEGSAVGGSLRGRISARFCVEASGAAEANSRGASLFRRALKASMIPAGRFDIDGEVMTLEELRLDNEIGGGPRIGATDVSRMLGVSRQRVYQLAEHADFPEPADSTARGVVWDRRALVRWAIRSGRTLEPIHSRTA